MLTTIATEYEFCSAHFLPSVPATHKCRRLHGHNYRLVIGVMGETDPDCTPEFIADKCPGMIIDFFDLDAIVAPIVKLVDHYCLNDIPGLSNPTAELIASWFYAKLAGPLHEFPDMFVRVYETPTCWAEVSKRCVVK
jgi:6-pyruvoyltetrahydropterin/6-carboxytetrahydropterin synthase